MAIDTLTLTVRLTPDERAACEAAARLAGLPLTVWVRQVLFGAAGLPVDSARRRGGWPLGRRRQGMRGPGVAVDATEASDGLSADGDRPDAA
jgi:hypothetical protein